MAESQVQGPTPPWIGESAWGGIGRKVPPRSKLFPPALEPQAPERRGGYRHSRKRRRRPVPIRNRSPWTPKPTEPWHRDVPPWFASREEMEMARGLTQPGD